MTHASQITHNAVHSAMTKAARSSASVFGFLSLNWLTRFREALALYRAAFRASLEVGYYRFTRLQVIELRSNDLVKLLRNRSSTPEQIQKQNVLHERFLSTVRMVFFCPEFVFTKAYGIRNQMRKGA